MEFKNYFTIVDKNYLPVKIDNRDGKVYEVSLSNAIHYSNKETAKGGIKIILERMEKGEYYLNNLLELPLQVVKLKHTVQMVLI